MPALTKADVRLRCTATRHGLACDREPHPSDWHHHAKGPAGEDVQWLDGGEAYVNGRAWGPSATGSMLESVLADARSGR